MVVTVDLAADLAAGEITRAGVGRIDEVVGVNIHIGGSAFHGLNQQVELFLRR